MKNVNFKKLKIQNFMSVGNDPIEINFDSGLNFITGYNRDENSYNGVGKTTIINSFFYCLFGTLYGDNSGKLKQSDIINNVVGGSPSVELEFESDSNSYKIVRSAKPSKCVIYRNGSEENQNFSIAETNDEICRIINGDSEIYSSIIIMDSDSKPFLLKERSKKIKFIENIFSLGVFSKMHKDVIKEYSEKTKELAVKKSEETQIRGFIENTKQNSKLFEDNKIKKKKEFTDALELISSKLSSIKAVTPEDQTNLILDQKNNLTTLKERLSKGQYALLETDLKINNKLSEITRLKSTLTNPNDLICRTCKRPLDESHSKEELLKENSKIESNIFNVETELAPIYEFKEKVKTGISIVESKIKTIENNILDLDKKQLLFKSQEQNILMLESKINELKIQLETTNKEKNPYENDIIKYNNTLKDVSGEVEVLVEDVEILDYVKYICSPEGVKAHIISKIVTLFNTKLLGYLATLGSPFKIEFDEFFDAIIKNSRGAEVSYHSLSGGERKRVELACLFAFRDIRRIQSNISINVTFLDELLDSALCSTGIEKAINILKESAEANKESIFIITHRASQIETVESSKTYNLERIKGVTKLVEIT